MPDEQKKSKMPDLNEITGMAGKLFKDLKKSVSEILTDYKTKRQEEANAAPKAAANQAPKAETKPEATNPSAQTEPPKTEESKPDNTKTDE